MNWKKIIKTVCVCAIIQLMATSLAYAQSYSYDNGRSVYMSTADRYIQQQLPSTLYCGDTLSIYGSRSSFHVLYGPNASYKKSGQEVYGVSDVNVNSKYISTSGTHASANGFRFTQGMSGLFIFYNTTNNYYKGASRKYITINHNWGGWYQTVAATCTSSGVQAHSCAGCGATETTTINAYGHIDNDGNGFCDRCGADIQIPKVVRGTYVRDNTGLWVYSYVQDNSGNVPYTRWWVWNTQDNNWRYFDYQYTGLGDFWINGALYNRRFRVNIADFGNSTGPYHVDCRAYDAAGWCSDAGIDNSTNFLRMCTNVYVDTAPPVIDRATYVADSTGYWVYSYTTDNEGISKVAYPSWTDKNGQDDLKANWWDTTCGENGSWTIDGKTYNNRYRVNKSDHNNESGPYYTHIYAYDTSGTSTVYCFSNIYLRYLVTYIDISISNGENGKELGRITKYADYDSNVAGADIGTDKTKSAYYENYQYEKCTSAKVSDQGATVYRHFKLSTVTITFHDQGGSGGPGTVTWLIGTIQNPNAPTYEGYNFAGWTTKEDGTGTVWPVSNEVPLGITDYYAQWIPNMYTSVQEQNQIR